MERCTHEVEVQDRLGDAMKLLTPQSRRLVELWLEGFSRQEIATDLRIDEREAAALCVRALHQVRRLLADASTGAMR